MFVIHLEKVDKSVTWHRLFSAAHYQGKAESGDVGEQINLALQFEGREEDKSFYWWKKAADSGNSHAELNVGKRYRDGQGVEKDEAKYQEYFVRGTRKAEQK
jgi:TPR repeat protein